MANIAEKVVEGYKKIENGVVEGYKKIENGVVEGYKKVDLESDSFHLKKKIKD
jgi:hypothetical protein